MDKNEEVATLLHTIKTHLSLQYDNFNRLFKTSEGRDNKLYYEGVKDGLGKAQAIIHAFFDMYMEKGGLWNE